METYFLFVVKVACSLSVLYLFGQLLFRNDTRFKLHRVYLLSSVAIALLMPFNKVSFRAPASEKQVLAPVTLATSAEKRVQYDYVAKSTSDVPAQSGITSQTTEHSYNVYAILGIIYWCISGFLGLRILYSLARLVVSYFLSDRDKLRECTIIYHTAHSTSYSFFRWIFISTEVKLNFEKQNIINHELVHARQFHSIDVMMVELLSAVMWFNPFIWLTRQWMQQLHEYLADEGVVNSGVNVLEYQALLVNQVAGDRLVCLPSGFNQSLIKKRLTMMTKAKINKKSGYRLLTLVPLTGLIFVAFSFTNKAEVTKDATPKSVTLINQGSVSKEAQSESQKSMAKLTASQVLQDTAKRKKEVAKASHNLEIAPPPPPPPPAGSGTDGIPPPPPPTNVKMPLPPSARVVTAVAPTKMNVLYLGVDNPLNIAVSGVADDRLTVETDNGVITKDKLMYVARPKQVGLAHVHVYTEMDGKKLHMGEMEFRVKTVPDPVASIKTSEGYKTNGLITKKELLDANGIEIMLSNFDFDLNFKVVSFVLSYTLPNEFKIVEEVSKSDKFTERQMNEIKSLLKWQKVTIEAITVVGPDGRQRKLNPMVFTIQD